MTGKIEKMTSTSSINISSSLKFNIDNYSGSSIFCNQYLRVTKEGYELYILGKNGEPKEGIISTIELRHIYLNKTITTNLKTNKNGVIKLGKLKGILSLSSIPQQKGDINILKRNWDILTKEYSENYPEEIHFIEGDKLSLPFYKKKINSKEISFVKLIDNFKFDTIISNEILSLNLEKNSIVVNNLKKGLYRLRFKNIHNSKSIVKIIVHSKARYWNNFILTDRFLIRNNRNVPFIFIGEECEINEEEKNFTINVNSNDSNNTRYHVIFYNFCQNNDSFLMENLRKSIVTQDYLYERVSLIKNANSFLSNKKLGDEICYILNRQKKTSYVGNTLEKPQIILKKKLIKETSLSEENLKQDENSFRAIDNFKKNIDNDNNFKSEYNNNLKNNLLQKFDSHFSFLKPPSKIFSNLKEKNGKIIINFENFKMFSTVKIIGINKQTCVNKIIPLEKNIIIKKDLSHKIIHKKDSYKSIFRKDKILKQNETFKVIFVFFFFSSILFLF